jgi:hypothetical protein
MREVRAIHHQGVYAVAAAFRQLYEMIEVEDERVHRRVAAANAAHLRKIEQLTTRIRRPEEELAGKARQVHQLNLTVREQRGCPKIRGRSLNALDFVLEKQSHGTQDHP